MYTAIFTNRNCIKGTGANPLPRAMDANHFDCNAHIRLNFASNYFGAVYIALLKRNGCNFDEIELINLNLFV